MGVLDGRSSFAGHVHASALSLDHGPPEVLPLFPEDGLDVLMAELDGEGLDLALRHRLIPVMRLFCFTFYGAASEDALREAAARDLKVVAWISPQAFHDSVFRVWGESLLDETVSQLARTQPLHSARFRLTRPQMAGSAALLVVLAGLAFLGGNYLSTALGAAMAAFFFGLMWLRMLCLVSDMPWSRPVPPPLGDDQLPVYTVLVPLFRETEVLKQLLRALQAIDYPVDKLDIKLLLEEKDEAMLRAVGRHNLPPHFDVITIPAGAPQTKPRALTYALHFARGSLLTIYDSEDVPDPQQLRLAAAGFAAAGSNVACLQAVLGFYNPDENWLTRQFTAEYAALFGVILPGLAACRLPLPLGGTSNHFRAAALRRVGAWDPFNVTEDADLGYRLAKAGYRTQTLDSTTLEEANTQLPNWMRQRRRWLKGFLHTWLVHMRRPVEHFQSVRWDGFLTFQMMTLGVFMSALLHPLLLAHALWFFLSGRAAEDDRIPSAIIAGISVAILAAGYGTALASAAVGLKARGLHGWWGTLLTIPLYWMLSMPAAWLALWDFIVRPHHWHKTQHGLSRLFSDEAPPQRRRRTASRSSSP